MYAKLFTSIYQGTLRGDSHGLLVFTNLIAHADSAGHVDIHPRAIADEVGLTLEQVRAALLKLEAPDGESRSPELEGRRIVRLNEHRDWGWLVVNFLKYRAIRDEEDRREQNRLAQQRWRERQKGGITVSEVSTVSRDKPIQKQKQKQKQENIAPPDVSVAVWDDWCALRKSKRAAVTATCIAGIRKEAEKAGLSLEAAMAMSCQRGWVGFKAEWVSENNGNGHAEPDWVREKRERAEAFYGTAAAKRPGKEIIDVNAKIVG